MGCGGSKNNDRHGRLAEKKISVQIGDQVRAPSKGHIIIFVFGGPGSKKGRLVSELVETYGFRFVNVEKLLLHHLLEKVPENERVGASFDVQEVIKDEPQLVSLHWLLGEVGRQISATGGGESVRFIIDIMPNLKFLINNDVFLSDCTSDMTLFEQQHPINFGINFIQRSAKKNKKETAQAKENQKSDAEKPPVRSDEADSSRTRRRITLFDNNVRPFIDYFQLSERLISMDLTGASTEAVWSRLCELFAGLEIHNMAHANYLLVFLFDTEQVEQASNEQGGLQPIKLASIVAGRDLALNETVATLCGFLDKTDPTVRTFLIDVRDTCLAQQQQQLQTGRSIVFVDEEGSNLPLVSQRAPRVKGDNVGVGSKFRAVTSTENRVCLFPCHVNLELCKDVAILVGNHLQHL